MNAETFIDTLAHFEHEKEVQKLVLELTEALTVKHPQLPSGLALDLRDTDKAVLEKIFNLPGFKIKFALKYSTLADINNCPEWISDIKKFLYPPKQKTSSKAPKPLKN